MTCAHAIVMAGEVAQLLHPAVGERAVRLRKSFACLRPVFCSSEYVSLHWTISTISGRRHSHSL